MSETPPPPPYGADPDQPPPTAPYQSSPSQQPPQQPYQQPVYGAPQFTPMYAPVAPDHPQSTTVLVLGILGLVLCQVLAPFAWVMGSRVVGEIDAGRGQIGGRGAAQAGRICGIIGTAILALYVIGFAILIVVAFASSSSGY